MPNWIEGTLKVRGTKADIERFLTNGLDTYTNHPPQIGHNDYGDCESLCISITDSTYIRDTNRAFVEYADDEIYDDDDILLLDIQQAWDLRIEEWQMLSNKYNLDFRVYGCERGMEFTHEIEILHGEITIDKVCHYNDYQWECILPNLGG